MMNLIKEAVKATIKYLDVENENWLEKSHDYSARLVKSEGSLRREIDLYWRQISSGKKRLANFTRIVMINGSEVRFRRKPLFARKDLVNAKFYANSKGELCRFSVGRFNK